MVENKDLVFASKMPVETKMLMDMISDRCVLKNIAQRDGVNPDQLTWGTGRACVVAKALSDVLGIHRLHYRAAVQLGGSQRTRPGWARASSTGWGERVGAG